MFQAWYEKIFAPVTVYAVDFNHDAFLVGIENKFKWVPMDEFKPLI